MTATMTNRYLCPVTGCGWYHEVGDPRLDDPAADAAATIELAIREHCDGHSTEEWLREVSQLRAQLAQQPPVQWCTHCIVEHKQAEAAGREIPLLFPGVVLATTSGPNGPTVALFCEVRHHLNVAPPKLLIAPAGAVPNGRPLG